MNFLKFETTISKGRDLCPYLAWHFSQVGIFAFMLLAVFSCQEREQPIQFLESSGKIQAITQDYSLAVTDNQMIIELPNGTKSSVEFETVLDLVPAQQDGEYVLNSTDQTFDLRLYSKDNYQAAYDLIFAAGENPELARFKLGQNKSTQINPQGDLLIEVEGGFIKHSKPYTYQKIDGQKKTINSRYVLEDQTYGFDLGAYDPAFPVIIDPVLSFEEFASDVFNASISVSNSTPSPRNTGENVVYVIKYSTQSNTNNFNGAEIEVTIPSTQVDFVTFTGTLDVAGTSGLVVGATSSTFTIFMDDPLPAGSTGQMELVVNYREGEFCDGDQVVTTLTRSATNDLVEPNEGPASASVTLNDDTSPFPPSISDADIFVDVSAGLTISVGNNNTIIDELTNAMLTVTIPAGVVVNSCAGCDENPNLVGVTELNWSGLTIGSGGEPFPTRNINITFPDANFDEGDMATFNVTLKGTDSDCANQEIELTASRKLTVDPLPDPEPRLRCVSMTINENEIGQTGTLAFSFKNNGLLAPVDDLTYELSIPNAMGISTIPNFDFSPSGPDYDVVYKTRVPGMAESAETTVNRVNEGADAPINAPGGAYFTEIKLVFTEQVPVGFMPNSTLNLSYEVLAEGLDGTPIEGANPRIPGNCGNTGFDVLNVSSTLSGMYDGSPINNVENQGSGCSATLRVADPLEGPQGISKTTDRGNGSPISGYFPQETVTFTLSFQNCGDDPLTSASITDELPEGLTLVANSFVYNGFSPAAPSISNGGVGPSTISWTGLSIPAGSDPCPTYTITFEATVNDGVKAGTLSNCFSVDGLLDGEELDDCDSPSDNDGSTLRDCASVVIRNVGPADLTKVDTDIDLPANRYFPGEVVEYTIGWTIESMFDAMDVIVTDVLPAGISFESFVGFSTTLTSLSGFSAPTLSPVVNLDGTTTLEWDFGALVFPGDGTPTNLGDDTRYEITYQVRIDEGALGNYENCFEVNAMSVSGMGDNVRMTPAKKCNTINVSPVGPTNPQKTFAGSNSLFPTQEIDYTITFQNAGPFAVSAVNIIDVLPAELEYVDGSVMYPADGSTQLPDPDASDMDDITFDYNDVTNTLSWFWPSLPGSGADEATTGNFTITFKVRIRPGIDAGTEIINCFEVDVDDDMNPNVAPRRDDETDYIVRDCAPKITVLTLAQVDSRKGIKGECDQVFKFFEPDGPKPPDLQNLNGIGLTFEGGSADYRLEICNTGNVEVDEFILIDILPWIGDIGVTVDSDRETMWRPNFAGMPEVNMSLSTEDVDASDFTIFYSVEQSPCRSELFDGNGSPLDIQPCSGPAWSTTPPADIARVQSIKIEFNEGKTLGKGSKIVLEWPMFAPVNTPVDLIAWNSFGYQGIRMDNMERFLVAEPNKVGIAVKEDPKAQLGDYVWVDRNDDGVQNESPLDGVNGVKVVLFRTEDMIKGNEDDVMVDMAVTGFDYFGNPGYYLFPNLDPGKYYVDFDENTLPATTSVIEPNQGDDDSIDSDGDQVMAMDDITELEEFENDRTHDLGLVPPDCDLSGSEIEKECIANDTEDPDDDEVKLLSFVVEKEKLESHPDDNGELIAGGETYTVIIQSCTASEEEGAADVTEQLFVATGLTYGVTYGFENGQTPIPGIESMDDAIFDAPEGTDVKILFLDEENPLCYFIEFLSGCYDYGDLPDTYSTTGPEAPRHALDEDLKLGACVDSELDGNPEAMAGAMEGGDDNTPGITTIGECAQEGSDEDGITFLTPMIPGKEACIEVTAMNMTGSAAKLQMWVDWNGDGDFVKGDGSVDDDEELVLNPENSGVGANMIPSGMNGSAKYCFMVPDDAKFRDGNAFIRFRLSPDGGLAPDSQEGSVPIGEVEDYKVALGKIGNLVFEDRNFDGDQDGSSAEPGIDGVEVRLVWAGLDGVLGQGGDDETYNQFTGSGSNDKGEYYFCGLIPGTYKVIFMTPNDMTPTRDNEGDQTLGGDEDSDGLLTQTATDFSMVMTDPIVIADVTKLPATEDENGDGDDPDGQVGTFPDKQVDETFDQGFAFLDYGDLPDDEVPNNDDDFHTTMVDGTPGAVHVVIPELYLGMFVDGDQEGAPSNDASGDDTEEVEGDDDEDGVEFLDPMIPGNRTCIRVTTTNSLANNATAILQAWIDWNGDGDFDGDANEAIVFESNVVPNGGKQTNDYCFMVPEGAKFNDGMVYARFRISPQGGLGPNGPAKYSDAVVPQGEVEDYKLNVGKIGNYVWEDYDYDGIQDAGEPAINDVKVELTWAGRDGQLGQGGDDITYKSILTGSNSPALGQLANGQYYFCGLINGTYKITVTTPEDMTPGRVDQGSNESLDSDGKVMNGDLSMVMTDPIVIADVTSLVEDENGTTDAGDDNTNPEPNADDADDVGTFPDNQVDERYDFAFNGVDYGDLLDVADNDVDYPTLAEEDGARHIIQPEKFLGSCVDGERDGAPNAEAGLYNGGDDNEDSEYVQGDCAPADANTLKGDDENGVEFPTPLVPGYEACVDVTYTAEDILPLLDRDGNVYLSAWIDFDGNNSLEADERVEFTSLDGSPINGSALNVGLANGTDVSIRLCFTVPGDATFAEGSVRSRFRLNCESNPNDVQPDGLLVGGEVEDYWIPVAKVGQYTWFDNDLKGDQEYDPTVNDDNPPAPEMGVNGVDFVLVWKGPDGVLGPNPALGGANDDRKYIKTSGPGSVEVGEGEDGIYYFCGLQEGSFQIVPLKYANPSNTGMTQVVGEDGRVYDISDPDNIIIDGGDPTPRYSLTPERKILTRPMNIGDAQEDSDGSPNIMFDVPDLVNSGFMDPALGEDGNGDVADIYDYPDNRTNLTIDFGWVQEPNIEVLQRIVGVDFPQSGTCDHFNVIVDVCLVNTAGYMDGNFPMGVPLKNLQLMGDLSSQLGATFIDVVSTQLIGSGTDNNGVSADITALEYGPTPAAPQQYPTLNPNYDGAGNKNLFDGNSGHLWPGEKVMLRYVFEVNPENVPMMQGIDLQWNLMGSGKAFNYNDPMQAIPDFFQAGGPQYMAMDVSSDYTGETGIQIDWTYNDPDDPTNLGDCWKKASQFAAHQQVNFTTNGDCEVIVDESNLIRPYYGECDEGVYPLGGYYRFRIEGQPGLFFEPTAVAGEAIVNGKIKFMVQTVNKICEPRWGELLIEDKSEPVIMPPSDKYLECWLLDDVLNNPGTVAPAGDGDGENSDPATFDGGDGDDDNDLGFPKVTDGCEGHLIPFKWSDAVVYYDCDSPYDTKDYRVTAVLTRRFSAADAQGNQTTATQTIYFVGPRTSIDGDNNVTSADYWGWGPLVDPSDRDGDGVKFYYDVEAGLWVYTLQSCDAPSEQVGELYPYYTGQLDCETGQFNQLVDIDPAPDNVVLGPDYRDAFGNKVRLDEVNCNLSVQTDNRQFSDVCSDGSYKQERHLRIFDWCEGSSDGTAFPYLVKVGDFAPPVLDNCVLNPLDVPGVRRRTNFGDAETVIELLNGDTDGDGDLENDQIRPEHIEAGQITFFDDEDEELKDEGYTVSVCLEMVSTGPMDCTASLNTDLGALRALWGKQLVQDCEDPTVTSEIYSFSEVYVGGFPTGEYAWQIGGYSMVGTMAVGIPVGLHALVFSATDNCYNSTLGMIFFTVMDGTKPVMKCDDELRVTLVDGDPKLQIQGYALATAQDVDEGSWDNCGPVDLHVRRIINDADVQADWEAKNGRLLIDEYEEEDPDYNQGYTGWDDLVEFFCGDLNEKVTVELRGSDTKKIWRKCIDKCGGSTSDDVYIYSMFRKTQEQQDDGWEHVKTPNQSVCWLEVEVENGTNYTVELDGGGTALCTDDFNADDFITVTYLGLQCASPDIEVVVEPELDQCGIGRYKIYLQDNTDVESKNRPNVDPNPVYVYVRPYHDYWIKFPKDAIFDCGEDQEVGGVETSADLEVGCDLLAISTLPDERFAATSDPDACYKIFRTYRVINWCEYDGQQDPVVVSRDWDRWNGFDFGTSTTSDDRDPNARREYNINPQFPDGDDNPGNTDLYVIVKRNLNDDLVDRVFYDADSDPTANVGEVSTDQPRFGSNGSGNTDVETYWWQVTSGSRGIVDLAPAGNSSNDYFGDTEANEPDWDLDTNNESYYDGSYRGEPVRWGYDPNVSNADPNGSANDSSDNDDDDQYYGSVGFWQYTQHIIVYDDTAPEVRVEAEQECAINGETCDAETSFDIVITDVCSLDDITVKVYVNGEAASNVALNATDTAVIATVTGRRGLGNYKISGEVNDGCGNITPFDGELEVVDCKAPAPICQNGMVVELMPQEGGGGAMAVWASDFIGSRVGDCTGQELDNLVPVAADGSVLLPAIAKEAYSIYFEDSVGVDFEYTSPYDSAALRGITLTCDHLAGAARNAVMIRVYAEDASGNHDFCRTFVDLQDNMGACSVAGATGDIAGAIETEQAARVEGVEVQLSGARNMMYMTDDQGDYGFNALEAGHDYSVIPHKDDNHGNGVSTFDLILIQKHILGAAPLTSPYQLIAADANNSQSVSTLDLIQIRKLILNIDREFTNNTSWRFVDADYIFPNASNPWQETFPEVKNFNNLTGSEEANFIAVKIGDVNESASVEARAKTRDFVIQVSEQSMISGNEYTIDFTGDLSKVAGYQFSLELAQVELVEVLEGVAKREHFGVFAEQGVITSSFNEQVSGEQHLFSIRVRAKADVKVSEAIGISSRYTAAEAYADLSDNSEEPLQVVLDYIGADQSQGLFVLNQNTPNPFQAETVISFLLPQAMEGVLEFKDVQGRTILMKEGDFTNGYNEVRLKANELPAAGVYFYTLHAGDYTATKKLILLKR